MSIDKFRHKSDCAIKRESGLQGPVATLYDSEWEKVWTFPDSFTDEQIMAALAFANHAYKVGIDIGSERKAQQIRSALGVTAAV